MLWDDVDALCLIPMYYFGCTGGASQKLSKFQHDQRMIQFLMGLNDSFTAMRGSILTRLPLPSIGHVYNFLLHEETQREIHVNSNFQVDSASLTVYSSGPGHFTDYENVRKNAEQPDANSPALP